MSPESSPGELSTVFAHFHGMVLREDEAAAAVQQLALAVRQAISTAIGAGVSLMSDDGSRTSNASTDQSVEVADALQYELGQGPCLSAWATGETQRVDDTFTDQRWLAWQSAAAQSGIRSVLSTPLRHRGQPLGALKVYAPSPHAFDQEDERLLELLADAAATLLGSAQASGAPLRLSNALKKALESRETIGLAAGVLIATHHLEPEAARAELLRRASSEQRRLVDVAAEILAGGEQQDGSR